MGKPSDTVRAIVFILGLRMIGRLAPEDHEETSAAGRFSPEDRRKHLDYIQAVITRQASNSFLIKGWTITVAVAAYGIALNSQSRRIAVLAGFSILVFWGLDTYFLRQERMFRCLFRKAASGEVRVYSMNPVPFKKQAKAGWVQVAMSYTLIALYGPVYGASWAVVQYLTALKAGS